MSQIKQEKNKILLQAYIKNLKEEEFRKRIGNSYNAVIQNFVSDLNKEARKFSKKSEMSPADLQKLAKEIERIKYLSFQIKFKYGGPTEILNGYQEDLDAAGKKDLPEMLKTFADIIKKSGEQIKIMLDVKVVPNQKLIANLKNKEEEFVERILEIIKNSAEGNVTTPYIIKIDDEATAEKFAQALKSVFNPLSKVDERVSFDQAKIPKNSYPLEINQNGNRIEISWPSWISVGAHKEEFSSLDLFKTVPKKI